MNLDNVVLVRGSSNLPLMGMIIPFNGGINDKNSDFVRIVRRLVKEKLESYIGETLDLSKEDDKEFFEDIVTKWYPLSSGNHPYLNFSLNGLNPEDKNKTVAVIDPIKYHQTDEFITVSLKQTIIKSTFHLSKEAIVFVEEERFRAYSQTIQDDLSANYNLELYTGSLEEAINSTLQKHNYPILPLTNIEGQEIGESAILFQEQFATQVGASNLSLEELSSNPLEKFESRDLIAAEKIKSHNEKNAQRLLFYRDKFYEFLLQKLEIKEEFLSDQDKNDLFSQGEASVKVLEILINKLMGHYGGLNGLKALVSDFNNNVYFHLSMEDEPNLENAETRK